MTKPLTERLREMKWGCSPAGLERIGNEAAKALEEAREALKPFAGIALHRDRDLCGPDMIDAPDLSITPSDVRRARAVLSGRSA